jgi:hypothetical protein
LAAAKERLMVANWVQKSVATMEPTRAASKGVRLAARKAPMWAAQWGLL